MRNLNGTQAVFAFIRPFVRFVIVKNAGRGDKRGDKRSDDEKRNVLRGVTRGVTLLTFIFGFLGVFNAEKRTFLG